MCDASTFSGGQQQQWQPQNFLGGMGGMIDRIPGAQGALQKFEAARPNWKPPSWLGGMQPRQPAATPPIQQAQPMAPRPSGFTDA